MTAEVAIMNLQAVALAADSAITASMGSNQKIFSSANKLFALSEFAPIGVLVYGNAGFMSIPWETIVKEYRCFLGAKTFAELHEYATDFCMFLSGEIGSHLSEEIQLDYAGGLAKQIFEEMNHEIHRRMEMRLPLAIQDNSQFEMDEVRRLEDELTVEIVNEYHSRAKLSSIIEGAPDGFQNAVRDKMRERFKAARESEFSQKRLRRGLPLKLNYIALKAVVGFFDEVTGYPSSGQTSGVVIAGFGDRDIFPALSELSIEGMVLNALKLQHGRKIILAPNDPSRIMAFAQTDMVRQFMEGIAPNYIRYLHNSVISHLRTYTEELLDTLHKYLELDTERLRSELGKYFPKMADSFVEYVNLLGAKHFSQPIMSVVAMLPKEQLAEMAESLVSLTALKRRVSSQEETVGGPTDVAVITKGDGLIWIKRKHYFAPELNPSYFERSSYRREQHAKVVTRVEDGRNAKDEASLG